LINFNVFILKGGRLESGRCNKTTDPPLSCTLPRYC